MLPFVKEVKPQGEFISGDSVILCAFFNNPLDIFIFTTNNEFVKALDVLGKLIVGVEPVTARFNITQNSDSVVLTLGGTMFLSYSTANGRVSINGTNNPIYFNQSTFEEVSPSAIVTSGIPYNLSGTSSMGMSLPLSFDVDGFMAEQMPQVLLLPSQYYSMCSSLENNTAITNLELILGLVQCSYTPTKTYCAQFNNTGAWTNQPDCFEGNIYDYCSAGKFCTGNCKSVCEDQFQICTFDSSKYECVEREPEIIQSQGVPVKPRPRIFLLVVGIVIILIILALLFWSFSEHTSNSNVHHEHYSYRKLPTVSTGGHYIVH